jgi:molybdopterin-guanine dinucleotide biosynthesis protein A
MEELKRALKEAGAERIILNSSIDTITVSMCDNPLDPQEVFDIMKCFLKAGAKDATLEVDDEEDYVHITAYMK